MYRLEGMLWDGSSTHPSFLPFHILTFTLQALIRDKRWKNLSLLSMSRNRQRWV